MGAVAAPVLVNDSQFNWFGDVPGMVVLSEVSSKPARVAARGGTQ